MRKPLFNLLFLPLIVTSAGVNSHISTTSLRTNIHIQNQQLSSPQIIAGKTLIDSIISFWQRQPRRRLTSRSGVCPISPGLIDTYLVWSDRPLFLWDSSGANQKVQLIVYEDETGKEVWRQTVNLNDQKVFYQGEKSLEPDHLYQWQLLGENNLNITPPSTFKIISASERKQMQSELQTLEQKLTNATPEEIALKKADYFVNYKITDQAEDGILNLWSDALESLYKVEQPSPAFIQKRQAKVENLCNSNISEN